MNTAAGKTSDESRSKLEDSETRDKQHTRPASGLYNTLVHYLVVHAQPDWKRLDSFQTQCQRRILHIRWYDNITNDEVLRRTGLLAASSIVRKQRLGLFGHVASLPDSPMMFQ